MLLFGVAMAASSHCCVLLLSATDDKTRQDNRITDGLNVGSPKHMLPVAHQRRRQMLHLIFVQIQKTQSYLGIRHLVYLHDSLHCRFCLWIFWILSETISLSLPLHRFLHSTIALYSVQRNSDNDTVTIDVHTRVIVKVYFAIGWLFWICWLAGSSSLNLECVFLSPNPTPTHNTGSPIHANRKTLRFRFLLYYRCAVVRRHFLELTVEERR